jgi:hypothetical protein
LQEVPEQSFDRLYVGFVGGIDHIGHSSLLPEGLFGVPEEAIGPLIILHIDCTVERDQLQKSEKGFFPPQYCDAVHFHQPHLHGNFHRVNQQVHQHISLTTTRCSS